MKKNDKVKRINLRATPFKGILTEIAKEEGTTRQAVWNAIYVWENPRIMTIFANKIGERKHAHRVSKMLLQAEFAHN